MQWLDAPETARRLDYQQIADAVAEVMALTRSGAAHAPARGVMPLAEDGTLLLMPATDGTVAVTKLVTVHPHNSARQLPTIQGEMTVMDAHSGQRHALVDGATVSARRTAAVSLLAAQRLAPRPDTPVLVYGAGTQARVHLEAFREGLGTTRAYIVSRTRSRAEALARAAADFGVAATVVDDPAACLQDTRLIVAATTATEPILPESLPADAFVAAVGAFRAHMAELPGKLLAMGRVVVDTDDGARDEAGDLITAAQAGELDWGRVTKLSDVVCDGAVPTGDGPILFKSVGHPLWDLAAGRVLGQKLGDAG